MSSPKYWREVPQRFRLVAARCKTCGATHLPPRLVCPGCKGREFETVTLPRQGVLEAFTVVRVAPSAFVDQAPYAIGIVRLEGGVRMLTQVVDCEPEDLKLGMPVRLAFRKISEEGPSGIIYYAHKAVPA
ncbi:MAG: Zn-ribbon domain-containing OB-fold protein [Candidatus Oleimicrobiaceae bacterium]